MTQTHLDNWNPNPGQTQVLADFKQGKHVLVGGLAATGKTVSALMLAGLTPEAWMLAASKDRASDLRRMRAQAGLASGVEIFTPVGLASHLAKLAATQNSLPNAVLASGAQIDLWIREILEENLALGSEIFSEDSRLSSGIVSQLRHGISQARVQGLTPEILTQWAQEWGVESWGMIAVLLEKLDEKLALRKAQAGQSFFVEYATMFDLAQEGLEKIFPLPQVLIVDDLQDFDPAALRILGALAKAGTQIVGFYNPYQGVEGFRLGCWDSALNLATQLESTSRDLSRIKFEQAYNLCPQVALGLQPLIDSIDAGSLRLPAYEKVHASAQHSDTALPEGVKVLTAATTEEHYKLIVGQILKEHLQFDTPYRDIAVVMRSGGYNAELKNELRRAKIPFHDLSQATVLAASPVAGPLLEMMEIVTQERENWQVDKIWGFLSSALLNLNAWQLRQLRDILLNCPETCFGPKVSGAKNLSILSALRLADQRLMQYLGAEIDFSAEYVLTAPPAVEKLRKLRKALLEARKIYQKNPGGIKEIFYCLWSALAPIKFWQDCGLGKSEDGQILDYSQVLASNTYLDDAMDLDKACDWFQERNPGVGLKHFVSQYLAKNLPTDSIAPHGYTGASLSLCTPAQIAGKRFECVIVGSLIDGLWPNLKLRNQVLRTELWPALMRGQNPNEDYATLREQVRSDEARFFITALSRASKRAYLACVNGESELPSPFVYQFLSGANLDPQVLKPQDRVVDYSWNGIIKELRYRLEKAVAQGGQNQACQDLARLIAVGQTWGIPGTDPDFWLGYRARSGTGNYFSSEITLSPSRVDAIIADPKTALFSMLGAKRESELNLAALMGTAIHLAGETLLKNLQNQPETYLLPANTLVFDTELIYQQMREQIATILELELGGKTNDFTLLMNKFEGHIKYLANFISLLQVHDWRSEISLSSTLNLAGKKVRFRARADLVHDLGNGQVEVLDIKTGNIIAKSVASHTQLGIYQLLAQSKGMSVTGGHILGLKNEKMFSQPSLSTKVEVYKPLDSQKIFLLSGGQINQAEMPNALLSELLEARISLAIKALTGPQYLSFPTRNGF